jgi:hypothetical protein
MAAQPDFWGEIVLGQVRTPLAVLREQAALLGPKTRNLVEATVVTTVAGDTFYHLFNLVAPALDGYTYAMFMVTHGIDLYPVQHLGTTASFPSEEAFVAWLRQELSSAKTKRIIANLLAQVTG